MNKIQLRPVAVYDLGQRFARKMNANKIRQYCISAGALYKNSDPNYHIELLKAHILNEEPDTEIEFLPPRGSTIRSSNALETTDITNKMFGFFSKTKRDMKREHINNTHKLVERIATLAEINAKFAGQERGLSFLAKARYYFAKITHSLGLKLNIHDGYLHNDVLKVSHLSYTYDESQEKEAISKLKKDLDLLSKRGLILGHLSMPSVIAMADTNGIGELLKRRYFVFHLLT